MGLTSAFSVGRTALSAYQAALQVTGQNIANVSTPGYTRSTTRLAALPGNITTAGQLGRGVQVSNIRRQISESLQTRLRTAIGDRTSANIERNALNRIEAVLNPLGDSNLGSLVSDFFSSVNDLQNNPENIATRGIVVNTGVTLTQKIRDIRSDLLAARNEINQEITTAVQTGDQLASQIADLNERIVLAESGSNGQAAALRDQRDQLLNELSEIFEVVTREQPNGAVNVYIGNESLIQFGESFGLTTEVETDANGFVQSTIRLRINNGLIDSGSGQIEGLVRARDIHNVEQVQRLDELTAALIFEVNKIHSSGQGLEGFTTVTGLNPVQDTTIPLNSPDTELNFFPETGSFFIDVRDAASGETVRTQINVNLDGIGADTTLDSLVADINTNVPNLTATILADGRVEFAADAGFEFTFSDDTSGTLAALGVNTFFTGYDSLTADVNPLIAGNLNLLAAGRSDLPGDGSNATLLAGVQDLAVASLGGASLNEHYTTTVANLAVSSSSATSAAEASEVIFEALTVQRESLSGVNLDEEALSLISYQRAFEGAARYLNVVDEMLQTLLGLVR